MKRLWLGIILLTLLPLLGVFESVKIESLTQPVSDTLSRAAQAALAEDWAQAQQLCGEAEGKWEAHWSFLAAMNHHGPMEEIDSQFARMRMLLQTRSAAEFSACCARMGEMIRALGDAHRVNLRNLL